MYAEAEGDVVAGVAVDVEVVRVVEGLGVAVADLVGHDQPLAGTDGNLDVLDRGAEPPLVDDVQVAQQLLYRRGDPASGRRTRAATPGVAGSVDLGADPRISQHGPCSA
jgi:hypothetical protein